MSAYTLVSLQSPALATLGHLGTPPPLAGTSQLPPSAPLPAHPAWDTGTGWTHSLNNLRLLLQPFVCTCLLLPWRHLLSPPHAQAVQVGLATLGSCVNTFRLALPT